MKIQNASKWSLVTIGLLLLGKSAALASQGAYTDHCRYSGVAVSLGQLSSANCTITNTRNEPIQIRPAILGVPAGIDSIGVNGGPLTAVTTGGNFQPGLIGPVLSPGQSYSFSMQFMLNGQKSVVVAIINLGSTASTNSGYLAESPVVLGVNSGVPMPTNLSVIPGRKSNTISFQASGSAVSYRAFNACAANPVCGVVFNSSSGPLDDIAIGGMISSGSLQRTNFKVSSGVSSGGAYYAVILVDAQGRESLPAFIPMP